MARCPPSLHWVPRVGSPASQVLRGTLTSCRPSRRSSSNFDRRYRDRVLFFAPIGGRTPALPWAGGLLRGSPTSPQPGRRRQDLPRSQGNPIAGMLPSHDPGEIAVRLPYRAHDCLSAGLPLVQWRRLSQLFHYFGAQWAAYWLAVYASQHGLPRLHARLASGRWLACPRESPPAKGRLHKVSVLCVLHHFPLV